MTLRPVSRRSVPDEVFQQILDGVVGGDFSPGDTLPSERRLAEVLGVSRPAVREALQRMAQAGLVEVRQGGSTSIRDFRTHAGLDLLPRLLLRAGNLDLRVVRSVLEARLAVGPKVAGLAARRAGEALRAPLTQAIAALESDSDPVSRQRHALTFWDHIVTGADSIAFRLMFNSLRAAYEPAQQALAGAMASEVDRVEAYRLLADAITEGDADGATSAAEDLLAPATEKLLAMIRDLEQEAT
ncbi:transcriptional regulator [Saccharomonospora marina XMU15]|uniref:Transcriptional regulator n=1 Tax=Saccharomonospora marina XMU15 TaxID=882083 RepID=H5WZR0_9PSEU|nr:GntR family transcriptional regulator [Saccharomonospora marina]EHR50792.1 transcriptional regulator [Saccharomonospora marina XMU15]